MDPAVAPILSYVFTLNPVGPAFDTSAIAKVVPVTVVTTFGVAENAVRFTTDRPDPFVVSDPYLIILVLIFI